MVQIYQYMNMLRTLFPIYDTSPANKYDFGLLHLTKLLFVDVYDVMFNMLTIRLQSDTS